MKVTIVYDNEVEKQGLRAGWGFSALVQAENTSPILFDTGADSPTLLHIFETRSQEKILPTTQEINFS